MHLTRRWIRSLPLVLLLLLAARGASAANWRDLQRVGDTAYFLVIQSGSASVERLQMDPNGTDTGTATGTRLPSISLSAAPTAPAAFFVDPSGIIYVAYADHIVQVTPNDPNPADITTLVSHIDPGVIVLYGVGDYLFLVRSATGTGTTVQAVKKADGSQGTATATSTRQTSGFAFQPAPGGAPNGEVFAFASASGSILLVSFSLDGTSGAVGTAQEAQVPALLGAARLFPFPDLTRVADAGGTVYSASDLLPLDSFGGSVDSLAFRGDVPLVLRGAEALSFTNTLKQVDLHTFPTTGNPAPPLPSALLVQADGSRLWAFFDDNDAGTNGKSKILQAQSFQLGGGGDLGFTNTPASGQPITLATTAFTPNGVGFDEPSGTLLVLDSAHLRLFRWTAAGGELPAVQLPDTPRFLATSSSDQIYLGYSGGKVKQVEGGIASPVVPSLLEVNDVKAPLCGLVTADSWIVTCQQGTSAGSTSGTGSGSAPPPRHHGGSFGASASVLYSSFDPSQVDSSPLSQKSAPLGSGIVWSHDAGGVYFLTSSSAAHGSRGPQVVKLPLATSGGTLGDPVVSALTSRSGRRSAASVTPSLPIVPVPSGGGVQLWLGSGQELDGQSLALLSTTVPAPSGAGALADATALGTDLWAFHSAGGIAEADLVTSGSVTSRALFDGTPLRLFPLGQELVALTSVLGVPTPMLWAVVATQPLAADFHFASTASTPLFDLAAKNYSQAGANSELTFPEIDMDPSGAVSTTGGTIQFTAQTPPEQSDAALTGTITGSGPSTTAKLHLVYSNGKLNGQTFAETADLTLTSFNATTDSLTGSASLNVQVGSQRLNKSSSASWPLPVGVDGSWILDLQLNAPSGTSITGSATLQVHPTVDDSVAPLRSITIPLSGTVDATTGQATLTGSNGDASLTLSGLAPLARGAVGTVQVQWLGQERSATLSGAPVD